METERTRTARLSLLALGTGSVAAQVVLLREILATFAGSEIMAGLALGLWLLCTGGGSLLGSRRLAASPAALAVAHLTLAFLPLAMLAAMRALPLVASVRGAAPGLPAGLLGDIAVFLPYGLVSGGMVPVLGRLAARRPAAPVSPPGSPADGARWAYALDSAGSAAGGLLLGIALAAGQAHGLCLAAAGIPHALMAARYVLAARAERRALGPCGPVAPFRAHEPAGSPRRAIGFRPILATALGAGPAVALLALGPMIDGATAGWRYPGQELLLVRHTPFGQIAVTRTGGQRNLLQDGIPLTSTGDLSAETRVHPALCQVPAGARVLLIGGSLSGSLREALRHHPARVDCVEIDAAIYALGRTDPGRRRQRSAHSDRISPDSAAAPDEAPFPEPALEAPAVRTAAGDGRAFLRTHRHAYDAILLHLPGPENAGLNRYYTEEFYREARAALRPGGILSFLLPSSPNYLGPEQLSLERAVTSALRRSFAEVAVLPGEAHLYLACDRPADLDIEPILAARGIATRRLLDYEWDELCDPFRRGELWTLLTAGDGSASPESGLLTPAPAPAAVDRAGRAEDERNGAARSNRDLAPAAFRHFLALRARLDTGGTRLVHAVVAVSVILALLACVGGTARRRAGPLAASSSPPAAPETARDRRPATLHSTALLFAVATSGFAAMATQLAILLLFQVAFGNLYLRLSLLVTLFLTGTAAGALLSPRLPWSPRAQVRLADAAVALAALAVGLLGILVVSTHELVRWIAGYLLLPASPLLAAVPIGAQFAAAGRIPEPASVHGLSAAESGTAGHPLPVGPRAAISPAASLGRLYAADLAGAACGTVGTGLWLLPHDGLSAVVAAVVVVKAASLAAKLATDLAGRFPNSPGAPATDLV